MCNHKDRWRLALEIAAGLILWLPSFAVDVVLGARFAWWNHAAEGWRFRLVEGGVEASNRGATRLIAWDAVDRGRWLAHREMSMASGEEVHYAAYFPDAGVFLSERSGDMPGLTFALVQRNVAWHPENGGRSPGVGGCLLTLLWVGVIAVVAPIGWWLAHRAWGQ